MRVLAVSDFFLPRLGGVERVIWETARCLGRQGVEVEILTRRLGPGDAGHEIVAGLPVHRIGPGPRPLLAELVALAGAGRAWARRQLGDFDLVHAHLTLAALPLLGEIGRRRLPLVATFYGPWHREYLEETLSAEVPSRWPGPLRRLARPVVARLLLRAQRRVLGAAGQRVVLSRHSRGELEEFGYTDPSSAVLVPGGVDLDRFRPRDRAEARARLGLGGLGEPLVVAVRRLVPRMGLDHLVAAVHQLGARYPRIGLAIGGSGPLGEPLGRQARAIGMGDRVRLLGAVGEDDLPWLYAAADVVALPSRALEGFGLPVLEAWATGVPVVGTPVGALRETVPELEPEFLAAGSEPGDIARALAAALGAGPAVGRRARELAEARSWERVTAELLSVYRAAVAAGGTV